MIFILFGISTKVVDIFGQGPFRAPLTDHVTPVTTSTIQVSVRQPGDGTWQEALVTQPLWCGEMV